MSQLEYLSSFNSFQLCVPGRPPWNASSLPLSAQPSLADFAELIKESVSQRYVYEDGWWCFAYRFFEHQVPILSDEALYEALSYFAEQQQQDACQLLLYPAQGPPPWTLSDYLAAAGLDQRVTQLGHSQQQQQHKTMEQQQQQSPGSPLAQLQKILSSSSNRYSDDALLGTTCAPDNSGQHTQTELMTPGCSSSMRTCSMATRVTSSCPPTSMAISQQQRADSSHRCSTGAHGCTTNAAGAAAEETVWQQPVSGDDFMELSACHFESTAEQQQEQQQSGDQTRYDPEAPSCKTAKMGEDSNPHTLQWQSLQQQKKQQQQQQMLLPSVDFGTCLPPVPAAAAAAGTVAVVPPGSQVIPVLVPIGGQQVALQLVPAGSLQQLLALPPGGGMGAAAGCFGGSLAQLGSGIVRSGAQQADGLSCVSSMGSMAQGQQLPGPQQAGALSCLSSGYQAAGLPGPAAAAAAAAAACHLMSGSGCQDGPQSLLPDVGSALSPQADSGNAGPTGQCCSLGPRMAGSGNQQQSWLGDQAAASGQQQQHVLSLDCCMAPGVAYSAADAAAAVQQQLLGGKAGSETRYPDGRFRDETRHHQRMAGMAQRCSSLFGGVISGHFRVEHHKQIFCLLCDGIVTPYEAYHVDALRKHYVRHHADWLCGRGVDVEAWRKSRLAGAASMRGAAAAAGAAAMHDGGGAATNAGAFTGYAATDSGGVGAAAAGGGDGSESAAHVDTQEAVAVPAAVPPRDARAASNRAPDGRCLDPEQHALRLRHMEDRAAALFGGVVKQHWSVRDHKSIRCHLCSKDVTPYAAYHPDCLRKHFIRHHEDVLKAAGVDVLSWSKGIQLGKRKLAALLEEQQQRLQQQQQLIGLQGAVSAAESAGGAATLQQLLLVPAQLATAAGPGFGCSSSDSIMQLPAERYPADRGSAAPAAWHSMAGDALPPPAAAAAGPSGPLAGPAAATESDAACLDQALTKELAAFDQTPESQAGSGLGWPALLTPVLDADCMDAVAAVCSDFLDSDDEDPVGLAAGQMTPDIKGMWEEWRADPSSCTGVPRSLAYMQ